MNGQRAKALRKQVYGEMSLRTVRTYMKDAGGSLRLHPSCLRAAYQAAKRGQTVRGSEAEDAYRLPYLSAETERGIRKAFRQVFGGLFGGLFGERTPKEKEPSPEIAALNAAFAPRKVIRRTQAR